jgi:biopolymer transport protein ExbD
VKLHRTFFFNPALCGIVPMINVLFLVLMFYSMGSRFILQPGIQIALSASPFSIAQGNAQIVSITAAPNPSIFHRDQRVSMETLLARLEANQTAERTLILKVDRNAPSWLTADLTNEAIRRGYLVYLAGAVPKP